jgi:hypothetical protein
MLVPGKKVHDALRRVVAEKSRVVPGGLFGNRCAARKQSLFILPKCRLDIPEMCIKSVSQFRTVIDGEVGSLTCKRRHQMGRVAHQRDAAYSFPSMLDSKGINWPYHGLGVSVRDESPRVRCSATADWVRLVDTLVNRQLHGVRLCGRHGGRQGLQVPGLDHGVAGFRNSGAENDLGELGQS